MQLAPHKKCRSVLFVNKIKCINFYIGRQLLRILFAGGWLGSMFSLLKSHGLPKHLHERFVGSVPETL